MSTDPMTPDTNAAPISDEERAHLRALYGDCDPREDIFGTGRMVMALDARLTAAEAERDQWKAEAKRMEQDERDYDDYWASCAALVGKTEKCEHLAQMIRDVVAERDALRERCEAMTLKHEAKCAQALALDLEKLALVRERDQARAAEARMRELLRRHEWAYDEECIDLWCMECHAGRNQGHKPNCALARALAHGDGTGEG